ncbi:response regulator transcription factor [Streptomyces physcomitrii]|uniref:Sensory transduction protein RegX3 n=1 Tax=Streptomyces physcomitrii TaxID=2724184 RepID=A0ABX1H787_9ACTN|nr:response regulator transcription factor [Streptomyces physcomitrii]NKI43170.1 response regulator transcription factor [Streptomyces physcomitrii]
MRVLLVEDDAEVADALTEGLQQYGWIVDHVATGGEALSRVETAGYGDIVLLDLNLPDMDGLEVCRGLRAACAVPIIAVTARSDEMDKVLGLRLGADDYIVKPYRLQELLARMAAVMRRTATRPAAAPVAAAPYAAAPYAAAPYAAAPHAAAAPGSAVPAEPGEHVLSHGRLTIDPARRAVLLDGSPVTLTRKEYELLVLLAGAPGRVFLREQLLDTVWDQQWAGSSRTLDTHVATLRRKLGSTQWIRTTRGVGFSFQPQSGT